MDETIRIYERSGPTRTTLDAVLHADGSVTISGYDLGDAPKEAYGREDLEYELTIPAAQVPRALAALAKALIATTGTPIGVLRALFEGDGVEHRFRVVP